MFDIEPGRDYAVVTGDVIDSSSLTAPERERLPEVFHGVSDTMVDWLSEEVVTPIAVFGGDSWQVLLRSPGDALRASIFIRASLLASELNIDTRLAVGIGGVDFVPATGIEQADGEAFRQSGRLLTEEMTKRNSMAFASVDPEHSRVWNLVFRLIDTIVRINWTENRARAVSGSIRGWTSQQIGELWNPPIRRQTVDRHLEEAGWAALEASCETFRRGL